MKIYGISINGKIFGMVYTIKESAEADAKKFAEKFEKVEVFEFIVQQF